MDIAEHLYLLANAQQRTADREAQLQQAQQLASSLLSLIDPSFSHQQQQQQQPGSRSNRSPTQPLSPSSGVWLAHLHSSCQYVDPHRCESQSVLELVPLLLLQLQRLSAVAAAAFVSDLLSIRWPHCCLVSLCSAALSLPLSIAQTRRLQCKIRSCMTQLRTQPSQPQALDYLPLVQCLFHLTVRYAAADSQRDEGDHNDVEEAEEQQHHAAAAPSPPPSSSAAAVLPALPLPASASSCPPPAASSTPVSWLSLLHLSLSLHRRDLLSNSQYLLDTRLHQSAPFSSYLHSRYQQLTRDSQLHAALDHHHIALIFLLAADDDYQLRAFRLLAALMRGHLRRTAPTPSSSASASSQLAAVFSSSVSGSSPPVPIPFFSPSFTASAPSVQLWRDVVSLPYFESKQALLLQFALYLMQPEEDEGDEGEEQEAGLLLSLSFHLVLLLFASFPPSRASVFEQIRSRLFFDSLPGSQRELLCSLLAFLVLSSPPSHLSPLREHVKRFLSCLTLPQPLSLSLHCLLSLLPVFLPSCCCCPLDDLFPFLNKWLRAYRSEHPSLSLCACLWLLGRMEGGDEDERGLLRIIEDGGRRMTEEGRAWMLSQLHRILTVSQGRTACAGALSTEAALASASPSSAAISISLSASSCSLDSRTLCSLLSSSVYSLSPLALSHVLHLLHSLLSHYLHVPAPSEAGRRSKWAVPQPLLHVAACFRLEWGSAGEEEDEDDVYARRRREEKGRKRRRKAVARAEQQARQQETDSVALRDPIALQLLCAWSALSADQAAFVFSSSSFSSSSSSSSAGSPASLLLCLMSGLLQQLLDGSSFVPLLQPPSPVASAAVGKGDVKDAEAAGGVWAASAVSASPTVSESLVSDHQRWCLLQALCVVAAQTLWEDTAEFRRASQQRLELRKDDAAAVIAEKPPPLSTFTFTPLPPVPVQADKREKDDETEGSPLPPVFSLLRCLSSAAFDSLPLSSLHQWPMLLLEQAAFLHLLTEVAPAPAEPPASSLSPSLLLSPAFLVQLLNDYALSVSTATAAAAPPFPVCAVDPSRKKAAASLPSLSLVSVSYAIRVLMQSILAQPATRFPSVPAAALLPSVTPSLPPPPPDSDAASSSCGGVSLQSVFRSVFDVYCATLGVSVPSVSAAGLTSSSPLLASPCSSIGRAVFVSARHLSALFERATASSSPAFSSPAWLKATAVYEQPEQYREEVWACRTQALQALNRLLQLLPDSLPADLLPAFASDSSASVCSASRRGLLSLLLVRLFLLELDSQMTVPLAHAYIDCIQTLQPAAAAAPSFPSSPLLSPSPSLRLTRALLRAVSDYPALLTADLRLARKVWRHILSSFHGAAGRAEAMQLVERTVRGMMAEEEKQQEERARREKTDALPDSLEAVRRTGRRRLRQRGRGRQPLRDAEDAAEDGSDDSEFDDHRERRQQRFLSRLSRSALMEAERQREDERQDRQELREKKLRKETLAAILRYCSREIKDMRTELRRTAKQQQDEEEAKDGSSFRSQLRSSVHSCSLFLSQVLSLQSCLSCGWLESLLDPSFSSSSLPSSDSPSLSLHSQLLSLLHDCLLCSAAIMRRVTAGLQEDDDDSGEQQEAATALAVDLLRALSSQLAATRSAEGGDRRGGRRGRKAEEAEEGKQQQKAALEFPPHLCPAAATAPASELTVLHHLRHLAALLAPSSPLLSFVSLPSLPSSKAVDVKLAIGKARSAALLLTASLQQLSRPRPQQPLQEEHHRGEDEAEAAESPREPAARRRSGRLRHAAEDVKEQQTEETTAAAMQHEEEAEQGEWEGWLQQLRQELEDGRSRRGGESRAEAARAVGVRRRRGGSVLHSRNRHVDALLAEERETQDSFMDLDDFLV